MQRYVCIHGHFYQPPRENPWLEDVELQDSALPYHDWNERITDECYATNAAARILDGEGWITRIVNNYARISFDFGPTLLSWLETNAPEVYRAVLEADRESMQNFSGHGSALAQAYNHMIMPLANRRDKYTQVLWGIRDFRHRFGRLPEGMWLPETAVDLETLDIMAEQGLRFTILAPHQARRVRKIGTNDWQDVSPEGVDPSTVYRLNLHASGRSINIFFYDAHISRAVAFEKLLANGERFARRLLEGFAAGRTWPQLVNIATDGETYGHHHRHGEMALAYALQYIESQKLARVTNYGEYLEKHPPAYEVEIAENTSWSCFHGVERWRSNCGCNSGMHPGWSQAWRAPLRNALNWLRNTLAPRYEEEARRYLRDPWEARDDYIEVILDRAPEKVDRFLARHSIRPLAPDEQVTVLKLLEMQRHAMLMFTSCGWFFDEISGIETVQVLRYAGRVLQLAREVLGGDLESPFLEMLAQAKSNLPEHGDGARIYEKFVRPATVDLAKVGAHYAISSLFASYGETSRIFCYEVHREDHQSRVAGKVKLAVGRARITSRITREADTLSYGVLHFGDHNLNGGIRPGREEEAYWEMVRALTEAFDRADFPEVLRLLDQYFNGATFSLKDLFRDQQRRILDQILDETLVEAEGAYRSLYERHAPLMRYLEELGIPRPGALQGAAAFILNADLRRAFAEEKPDVERVTDLLDKARTLGISLDGEGLGFTLAGTVARLAEDFFKHPTDLARLQNLDTVVGLARILPFEVDLWKVQNIYYRLLQTLYPEMRTRAEQEGGDARAWRELFDALGDRLRVRRNK